MPDDYKDLWPDKSRESEGSYVTRINGFLPHFPDEVILHWLWEHGLNGPSRDFIAYEMLRFNKTKWTTEQIMKHVVAYNEDGERTWRKDVMNDPRVHETYGLLPRIRELRTWPVAPVVLDNPGKLKDRTGRLLPRYCLIEGHKRLGYLHVLQATTPERIISKHDIWMATYASE